MNIPRGPREIDASKFENVDDLTQYALTYGEKYVHWNGQKFRQIDFRSLKYRPMNPYFIVKDLPGAMPYNKLLNVWWIFEMFRTGLQFNAPEDKHDSSRNSSGT